MNIIFYGIAFLLGLVAGSFLNVFVLRAHTGQKLTGRSKCMSCGRQLIWSDLIPVVSFFILKGKCRRCGSRISWQYPVVELLTGLVFMLIALKVGWVFGLGTILALLFYWFMAFFFLAITIYDIRHFIIPDDWLLIMAPVAFLSPILASFSLGAEQLTQMANGVLAGVVFFSLFWLIWKLSQGRLIGLGDGKLTVIIGLWLGLSVGGLAIILAFWIGAVYGLVLIGLTYIMSRWGLALKSKLFASWLTQTVSLKTAVPFGPFLVLGTWLVWFFDWKFGDLINLFIF
jgi:prepilin signal peptidase PulO-like enzyme (type II secretory pathway)